MGGLSDTILLDLVKRVDDVAVIVDRMLPRLTTEIN
jgi:hypothetical protein